jgi:hypothetical protein
MIPGKQDMYTALSIPELAGTGVDDAFVANSAVKY